MNGIWRCGSYSFAPNYYKYCGPDKNAEIKGYLKEKVSDSGLENLLKKFSTMYPYLELIARENGLADEFDERVIDAYWLGNSLLNNVSLNGFYNHAYKKIPVKARKWFAAKLPQGAKPNHQFHVLNFWRRTGHKAIPHTVETMDSCRISAGELIESGKVKTDQLVYSNGKLHIKHGVVKEVKNIGEDYQKGDLVTIHWGWICEKIIPAQAKNLKIYTNLALRLANITI